MRSLRNRSRGGRAMEPGVAREALEDHKLWATMGTVVADKGGSHYEVRAEDSNNVDILVEVLLASGEGVTCRLGGFAGGAGIGVWRIPPVGSEVAVLVPTGELEADPIIVAVLSANTVPDNLDADTLVIRNTKDIKLDTPDGTFILQGGTKRVARKTDPINAGRIISAVAGPFPVTFVYAPPIVSGDDVTDGPPGASGPSIAITGYITDGAEKVKA